MKRSSPGALPSCGLCPRARVQERHLFPVANLLTASRHLSRHFDGRDVKILNKLVFPWKKVVDESVIEKYAEQRVSYSCSAWNKD